MIQINRCLPTKQFVKSIEPFCKAPSTVDSPESSEISISST